MEKQIEILIKTRKQILSLVQPYHFEQLTHIPQGFNNHIAWNIAHLTVTQQLLCYKLSGLDGYVETEWIERYRKGTKPISDGYMTAERFEEVKEKFMSLPLRLQQDYEAGLFKDYQDYPTSLGITLSHIDDAIAYNTHHEGIHLGSILALRKLV